MWIATSVYFRLSNRYPAAFEWIQTHITYIHVYIKYKHLIRGIALVCTFFSLNIKSRENMKGIVKNHSLVNISIYDLLGRRKKRICAADIVCSVKTDSIAWVTKIYAQFFWTSFFSFLFHYFTFNKHDLNLKWMSESFFRNPL